MNRRTIHALLAASAITLAGSAAATGFAAPAASPSVGLPSPTGSSAVGAFSLHWTDASRPDPFVANKRRELMVQFWYPSGHTSGSSPARYLPARTARVFERFLGISTPVFDRSELAYRVGLRQSQLRLTLRGSAHYTYTDFAVTRRALTPLAPPSLRKVLTIGSIDGRRALAIQRHYLAAFFRRYLKGTSESLLARPPAAYPEIIFEHGTR